MKLQRKIEYLACDVCKSDNQISTIVDIDICVQCRWVGNILRYLDRDGFRDLIPEVVRRAIKVKEETA